MKRLITVRAKLNGAVLDGCHEAGIEIVSPSFMNQRQVGDTRFIPRPQRLAVDAETPGSLPEAMLFDKAEQAEYRESLLATLRELDEHIEQAGDQVNPSLVRRRELVHGMIEKTDGAPELP